MLQVADLMHSAQLDLVLDNSWDVLALEGERAEEVDQGLTAVFKGHQHQGFPDVLVVQRSLEDVGDTVVNLPGGN